MSGIQFDGDEDLYYMYAVISKLEPIRQAECLGNPKAGNTSISVRLFPRSFLLKLLERRLITLDEVGTNLALALLNRLSSEQKEGERLFREELVNNPTSSYPELDEYFHYGLYYLYDFLSELDWYETSFDEISKLELAYVDSRLQYMSEFLQFQKTLTEVGARNFGRPQSVKSSAQSPRESSTLPSTRIKSSLSSNRAESPRTRRHVRFIDSPGRQTREQSPAVPRSPSIVHSSLALDLLIFSLHLFARQLSKHLVSWINSKSGFNESLDLIRNAKHRIRTAKLYTISGNMKNLTDLHLSVLDHLIAMRESYLTKRVLGIICIHDTERALRLNRTPRTVTYMLGMLPQVEQTIVLSLANQCLQLLADLVTSEINLPPAELAADTKSRSREEATKSRENFFNFLTSWLDVDKIVFGTRKANKVLATKKDFGQKTESVAKVSTLATGGKFISSSRILAQMDNLGEMMRDLIGGIADRLRRNKFLLEYCLKLIFCGLEQFSSVLEEQLSLQLKTSIRLDAQGASTTTGLDLIAAKIRYLKFIHIFSSIDSLLEEMATRTNIDLGERRLQEKLNQYLLLYEKCLKLSPRSQEQIQ